MSIKPYQLLIVGAGLTASVTSSLVKTTFPKDTVEVHVWEKSRGVGGRMNTNRSLEGLGTVDLGAQYITCTQLYEKKHKKYFDDLIQADVLKSFTGVIDGLKGDDGAKHFVAPNGINQIVKYFFNSSDANISLNTHCQELNLDQNNIRWKATTKDGNSFYYHGIIITIPVPQILQLEGTIQEKLKLYSFLKEVEYSSRYAVALYFAHDAKINFTWTAKFINDHPCIRFVCIDSAKRGIYDRSPSILIHTSVSFGVAHLEATMKEVEITIYNYFKELFPSVPQPVSTRCLRWRYSQVNKPYPGQPGAVVVSKEPLLILAGDSFVHSNFSGCVESANAVLDNLKKYL